MDIDRVKEEIAKRMGEVPAEIAALLDKVNLDDDSCELTAKVADMNLGQQSYCPFEKKSKSAADYEPIEMIAVGIRKVLEAAKDEILKDPKLKEKGSAWVAAIDQTIKEIGENPGIPDSAFKYFMQLQPLLWFLKTTEAIHKLTPAVVRTYGKYIAGMNPSKIAPLLGIEEVSDEGIERILVYGKKLLCYLCVLASQLE